VPETDPIAIANEVPNVVEEDVDQALPTDERLDKERTESSVRENVSFMLGSQIGRFRRFLHGNVLHERIDQRKD
jgi:hypothetical protein